MSYEEFDHQIYQIWNATKFTLVIQQDLWDLNKEITNLNLTGAVQASLMGTVKATANALGCGVNFKVNSMSQNVYEGSQLEVNCSLRNDYAMSLLSTGYNKFTLTIYHLPVTLLATPTVEISLYLDVWYPKGEKPTPGTVTNPPVEGGGTDWASMLTTILPLLLIIILLSSATSMLPRSRD